MMEGECYAQLNAIVTNSKLTGDRTNNNVSKALNNILRGYFKTRQIENPKMDKLNIQRVDIPKAENTSIQKDELLKSESRNIEAVFRSGILD